MNKIIINDSFYIELTRTYDLVELKEIDIIDKKTKKPTGQTKIIKVDHGYHKDLPHALIKYAKVSINKQDSKSVEEYLRKYQDITENIKLNFRKED